MQKQLDHQIEQGKAEKKEEQQKPTYQSDVSDQVDQEENNEQPHQVDDQDGQYIDEEEEDSDYSGSDSQQSEDDISMELSQSLLKILRMEQHEFRNVVNQCLMYNQAVKTEKKNMESSQRNQYLNELASLEVLDDTQSILQKLDLLTKTNNFKRALELVENLKGNNFDQEDQVTFTLLCTELYDRSGYEERAIELLKAKKKKYPDIIQFRYLLGKVLLSYGDEQEAIQQLRKVILKDQSNYLYYYYLGVALIEQDEGQQAVQVLKRAIELNGTHIDSYFKLAQAYQQIEEDKNAIGIYKKALQLEPKNIFGLTKLGNLYYDLEQNNKALEVLTDLMIFRTFDRNVFFKVANILDDLKKVDDSILAYRKAIQLDPTYDTAYYNLATSLEDIGEIEQAIFNYQKAIEINQQYEKAYIGVASVYQKTGQYDQAKVYLEAVIKINSDYAVGLCNLGELLIDTFSQPKEAIKLFEHSIFANPKYSRGYVCLIKAMLAEGNYKYINEIIEKMPQKIQKDPSVLTSIGMMHFFKSEVQDAKKYFQEAIDRDSQCESAYESLALTYTKDNQQYSKAFQCFQKVLQLNSQRQSTYTHIHAFLSAHHQFSNLFSLFKDLVASQEASIPSESKLQIFLDQLSPGNTNSK